MNPALRDLARTWAQTLRTTAAGLADATPEARIEDVRRLAAAMLVAAAGIEGAVQARSTKQTKLVKHF